MWSLIELVLLLQLYTQVVFITHGAAECDSLWSENEMNKFYSILCSYFIISDRLLYIRLCVLLARTLHILTVHRLFFK